MILHLSIEDGVPELVQYDHAPGRHQVDAQCASLGAQQQNLWGHIHPMANANLKLSNTKKDNAEV